MLITLVGSTRFHRWFDVWNVALTLAGHTVLALSRHPAAGLGLVLSEEKDKHLLDEAHRRKILFSDAVLLLNPFAYLGASSISEITYARTQGKRLFALESWGISCGIGPAHFEEVQKNAAIFSVPSGFGSPIDTTSRAGFAYPWDLLGEEHRRALVAFIEREIGASLLGRKE